MPLPLLPNPRKVLREAMLAQTVVTDSPIGNRILYAVPGIWPKEGTKELMLWVLTLVDAAELRPETNTCRVQVDIWGSGSSSQNTLDAEDSAALLRSVTRDLDGDWVSGKIRACTPVRTLPSPDPSGRARVIVDLEFQLNQ